MVGNIYEKVLRNKNIKENLEYYLKLQKLKQEDCCGQHLPIILGRSMTTKVLYNGISEGMLYKKCLLCGKDLSMESCVFEKEFDASNYKKVDEFENYEAVLKRYDDVLNLFLELCHATSTKEELFEQFDCLLNPNDFVKKLK